MARKYSGKVRFLGIMVGDTEADAKKFLKKYRVPFPNGLDPGNISKAYNLIGHPTMFFIDEDGSILGNEVGPMEEKRLEKLIQTVFIEKKPYPTPVR